MKLIVDTNVLVRMGFMLTATLFTDQPRGYVVCTLEELIAEFKNNSKLTRKYPKGFVKDYIKELQKIVLRPTPKQAKLISANIDEFKIPMQEEVRKRQEAGKVPVSMLSKADIGILFTAWTLGLNLVTDEDSMTRGFNYLYEGNDLKVFSTLTFMKLLEDIGVVNEDKRSRCIKKILSDGSEFMPKGWKQQYQAIYKTNSIP